MKLTKDSLPLFTRGCDLNSVNTQLFGEHEPVITTFISSLAKAGFKDFLLDIGANIGLTSCQNGPEFSVVHMFEPNPLCQLILEANTAIMLDTSRLTIHRYALGSEEKPARLMVPPHNWGGGYIDDPSNSYDKATLVAKDGFSACNVPNYLQFDVEIKKTATVLNQVFTDLSKNGLKRGVIKIDVEGFEPVVIQGIAEALPREVECYIIFESFNGKLDVTDLASRFQGKVSVYKIGQVKPWRRSWPKLIKLLFLLFNDTVSFRLDLNESGDWRGDVVFHVNGGRC